MDISYLISHFENNCCEPKQNLMHTNSKMDTQLAKNDPVSPFSTVKLVPESEFSVVAEALMEHISNKCQQPKDSIAIDQKNHVADLQGGIDKEAFKAELMSHLAIFVQSKQREHENNEIMSSNHPSGSSSKKRKMEEKDDTMVKLQFEHGLHRYDSISSVPSIAEDKKYQELEKEKASLKKRCESVEGAYKVVLVERKRLQNLVQELRRDVFASHQDVLKARRKTKEEKDVGKRLKAQVAESKVGPDAISNRIKELNEIQERMMAAIRAYDDMQDKYRSRKTIELLEEQISRLGDRIVKLLTRKGRRGTDNLGSNNPSSKTRNRSIPSGTYGTSRTLETSRVTGFIVGNGAEALPESMGSNEAELRPQDDSDPTPEAGLGESISSDWERHNCEEKQLFAPFRKFGSELNRVRKLTASKTSLLRTVERTCKAVQKDREILSGVIYQKDGEIERMQQKLHKAEANSSLLQDALENEYNKLRPRNRGMKLENRCSDENKTRENRTFRNRTLETISICGRYRRSLFN